MEAPIPSITVTSSSSATVGCSTLNARASANAVSASHSAGSRSSLGVRYRVPTSRLMDFLGIDLTPVDTRDIAAGPAFAAELGDE